MLQFVNLEEWAIFAAEASFDFEWKGPKCRPKALDFDQKAQLAKNRLKKQMNSKLN